MRAELFASAARITLCIAILAFSVTGDPTPGPRNAMDPEENPPLYQGTSGAALAPGPPTAEPTLQPSAAPEVTGEPAGGPSPTVTPAPSPIPALGPPTWIEAAAIGLYAPVVEIGRRTTNVDGAEVTEWEVPDDAAGFHKGSAYPGQPGNTVISGHNNMGSEVFRRLIDLNVDDEVILYVDKVPFHYRVAQKELVPEEGASDEQRRENGKWISPTSDERLTLVTCWPYTGNTHRLVIVARPVR